MSSCEASKRNASELVQVNCRFLLDTNSSRPFSETIRIFVSNDSSQTRKPTFGRWQIARLTILLLFIGCCIASCIAFCSARPDFTTTSLSLDDFKKRFPDADELRLPRSAKNILYGQSSVGLRGWLQLYRFDAPVSDCITFGRQLLEKNRLSPLQPPDPKVVDLIPLASSPVPIDTEPLRWMGLSDVDWFDVESVHAGFEGHVESLAPHGVFWIDTDRGRFYFYSID
jgi:hypothetical protein